MNFNYIASFFSFYRVTLKIIYLQKWVNPLWTESNKKPNTSILNTSAWRSIDVEHRYLYMCLFTYATPCWEATGIPHFIVLCRYWIFYELKFYSNPDLNKSISAIFPSIICTLCVSESHFGNTCNISTSFHCYYIYYGDL